MNNYQAWQINLNDFPVSASLRDQLLFICNYGLVAPSVHNTQPWQLTVSGSQILVSADQSRRLQQGDPTGRETWLSLACCAENLILAAEAFGFKVAVAADYDEWRIQLDFTAGKQIEAADQVLTAITNRVSDRSNYQTSGITIKQLKRLQSAWKSPDIMVQVTTDRAAIELVAGLTGRAIGLALSLPAFKNELAHLLRPNWTTKSDGLTGSSLGLGTLRSIIEPWRFRLLSVSAAESALEQQRLQNSGGLVLVFSRGDIPRHWLDAGRAYQKLAIETTRLGLAQSTNAAVVEAPDFHTEVEKFFKTDFRLQTVMRIGHSQQTAPHSPRRQLIDVATST